MTYKMIKREIRKNPKIHSGKEHWSTAQKYEAVAGYLMTGSWVAVNAATGIPVDTLKHWKMQDWWKEYANEIRHQNNIQVSGKLQRIINKSADIILDRLENGDIHVGPTGQITRRELNAKVASEIMGKSLDKDILIQKLETAPETKEEAIMDRLKAIQEELRKNAKKSKSPEIIDVIPNETPEAKAEESEEMNDGTESVK